MRRVLSVHHYPDFGGPHNEIRTIEAELHDLGFETVVLLPGDKGTADGRLRGVVDVRITSLHRLHRPPSIRSNVVALGSTWADIQRIRRVIREVRPDLVRVHGTQNPHGAIAAWLERVPVVWVISNALSVYPHWVRWLGLLVPRLLASVVLANGVATIRSYPGWNRLGRRTFVYYPGVDTERFVPVDPAQRRLRKKALGLRPEAPVVVSIGGISPIKGTDLFLDVAERVAAAVPGSQFVLVGATTDRNRSFEAAIRASVLHRKIKSVTFLGHRDDVEHVLAAADVAVIASRSEGTTTTAGEAMSSGVPVVATDVGAVREVLPDGRAGFLEPLDREDLIASRVVQLLKDGALSVRMGRSGRSVAVARYAPPRAALAQARAYEYALREPRTRWGSGTRRPAEVGLGRGFGRPSDAAVEAVRRNPRDWLKLQCPRCLNSMPSRRLGSGWICDACGWTGLVVGEIPILLADPEFSAHDEVDHHRQDRRKAAQVTHFNEATEEEFEITRPHGTVRLYRFLLGEKFRRAVGPIRNELAEASALTVCGGSGMDAEYLVRAGASVTTSDVSLGAAQRARLRSERYELGLHSIVADVERLPLADQSVDVVAVHDGLHHLEDPYLGLSEMARVARRWVVVTEPSRAFATKLAIRFGMALEAEVAGNRVARLDPSEVARFLEYRGYVVLRAERYAMYYPHQPGIGFGLLSRQLVYPITRSAWRLANALIGRFGNKMVVVAERHRSLKDAFGTSSLPDILEAERPPSGRRVRQPGRTRSADRDAASR